MGLSKTLLGFVYKTTPDWSDFCRRQKVRRTEPLAGHGKLEAREG